MARLEFELNRDFLRDYGINGLQELYEKINAIWYYLTNDWLSIRNPNKRDKTRSRWPVVDWWKSLSKLRFTPEQAFTGLIKVKTAVSLQRVTETLLGCITTLAAHQGWYTTLEILKGLRCLVFSRNTQIQRQLNEKVQLLQSSLDPISLKRVEPDYTVRLTENKLA